MNKVNVVKSKLNESWLSYTSATSLTSSLQNSPNNLSGISNPPGTPRDDGELGGNFLHSFQSENVSLLHHSFTARSPAGGNVRLLSPQYSPTMTMSVWPSLPSPHLCLFAIIPRIWTRYRTRPNTSATNQGWAPFWFAGTPTGAKNPNGWLLLLAQNEGQFLHRSVPSVTKPATENAYMTPLMSPAEPPPPPVCNPLTPPDPRAQKKSLALLLWNNCFVAQENVSASVAENTGECRYASWAWKVWLFHFPPLSHALTWRRTPLPIVPFFLTPVLLFKEVFKGKRLLFRCSFAVV